MNLSGVLFFPVTPCDGEGAPAEDVPAEHIARGLRHGPGAVFVACGTGEFSALSQDEQARAGAVAVELTQGAVAVELTQGAVPVIAGAGGPLGVALAQARAARDAGADGLLTPEHLPELDTLIKTGLSLVAS